MAIVPVVLGRDLFAGQIRRAEVVGPAEFVNRFLHPADAAKHVAVHVVRVRDGRRQPRERGRVVERAVGAPDVLVGMSQIVMCGEVIGR